MLRPKPAPKRPRSRDVEEIPAPPARRRTQALIQVCAAASPLPVLERVSEEEDPGRLELDAVFQKSMRDVMHVWNIVVTASALGKGYCDATIGLAQSDFERMTVLRMLLRTVPSNAKDHQLKLWLETKLTENENLCRQMILAQCRP